MSSASRPSIASSTSCSPQPASVSPRTSTSADRRQRRRCAFRAASDGRFRSGRVRRSRWTRCCSGRPIGRGESDVERSFIAAVERHRAVSRSGARSSRVRGCDARTSRRRPCVSCSSNAARGQAEALDADALADAIGKGEKDPGAKNVDEVRARACRRAAAGGGSQARPRPRTGCRRRGVREARRRAAGTSRGAFRAGTWRIPRCARRAGRRAPRAGRRVQAARVLRRQRCRRGSGRPRCTPPSPRSRFLPRSCKTTRASRSTSCSS